MTGLRIAVIDDHPLFREGVKRSLGEISGFEIVAEGSTKEDAIRIAQEYFPDVILLDISMPGGVWMRSRRYWPAFPIRRSSC